MVCVCVCVCVFVVCVYVCAFHIHASLHLKSNIKTLPEEILSATYGDKTVGISQPSEHSSGVIPLVLYTDCHDQTNRGNHQQLTPVILQQSTRSRIQLSKNRF